MPPADLAEWLRSEAVRSLEWAEPRERRFRRSATAARVLTLVLTATASVVLGLQHLTVWAAVGFSLVSLATVIGAVEPLFSWRSRWVLMEGVQYQLKAIYDELNYVIATTPTPELTAQRLEPYFRRIQAAWAETNQRWLGYRHYSESR